MSERCISAKVQHRIHRNDGPRKRVGSNSQMRDHQRRIAHRNPGRHHHIQFHCDVLDNPGKRYDARQAAHCGRPITRPVHRPRAENLCHTARTDHRIAPQIRHGSNHRNLAQCRHCTQEHRRHLSREFMAGIIPQRCRHLCDAAIPRNERDANRSVIGHTRSGFGASRAPPSANTRILPCYI